MHQTSHDYFNEMREQYFKPLCQVLELSQVRFHIEGAFAISSAVGGNIRVFFEYDRGLCSFGIGEAADNSAMCGIESLAERFPRVRLIPEGHQRLSLDEQSAFIEARWEDLQIMFSPDHIQETKTWQRAVMNAYMKKFTRDT